MPLWKNIILTSCPPICKFPDPQEVINHAGCNVPPAKGVKIQSWNIYQTPYYHGKKSLWQVQPEQKKIDDNTVVNKKRPGKKPTKEAETRKPIAAHLTRETNAAYTGSDFRIVIQSHVTITNVTQTQVLVADTATRERVQVYENGYFMKKITILAKLNCPSVLPASECRGPNTGIWGEMNSLSNTDHH